MSMFINQMLGCLIIAAGIGGVVGWLLRNVSAGKLTQQLADVTAMMHLKEQMLEKARHELRATASEMQALESRMTASQALSPSNQEELSLPQERIREFEELHHQLRKQIEDNEALKAAYTQAVAEKIDKAA